MNVAHREIRRWGEGELTIGFDADGRWLFADYKARGKRYGPVRLFDLPESYDDPKKMKWAVRSSFDMFSADRGGEEYFGKLFGPEAGDLAYGAYRRKAVAAREVIGRPEAVKIAEGLLEAFYAEAPPWKTPFDNWGIVNKLGTATFGKFSVDELMKILEEADESYHGKKG